MSEDANYSDERLPVIALHGPCAMLTVRAHALVEGWQVGDFCGLTQNRPVWV